MKKILLTSLIVLSAYLGMYYVADAYSGIFTCSGVEEPGKPACDFNQLIVQVQYIIDFAFKILIPFVTCIFIYAGFKLMSNNPSDRSKAKDMMIKIGIGFVLMCTAFIIVKTIMIGLTGGDSSKYLFFFK